MGVRGRLSTGWFKSKLVREGGRWSTGKRKEIKMGREKEGGERGRKVVYGMVEFGAKNDEGERDGRRSS